MGTRKITPAVRLLLLLGAVGIGVLMLLLSAQANSKGRGSQSVTPVVAATPYASSAAPTKLVSCQSSQSVTPVIAATPSASSPGPTKLVSWPPTISAEEAQKGRLATELDYLLREQPGLVIAHEENNKVADPLVQCYQIEEVSLGRSVQFAVSGPSLCYCDEISIIPPELVKERTLITISKVWRITINGGPFPAGANYWYIVTGNDFWYAGGTSTGGLSTVVHDKNALPEGAPIQAVYAHPFFTGPLPPLTKPFLSIHYNQ